MRSFNILQKTIAGTIPNFLQSSFVSLTNSLRTKIAGSSTTIHYFCIFAFVEITEKAIIMAFSSDIFVTRQKPKMEYVIGWKTNFTILYLYLLVSNHLYSQNVSKSTTLEKYYAISTFIYKLTYSHSHSCWFYFLDLSLNCPQRANMEGANKDR